MEGAKGALGERRALQFRQAMWVITAGSWPDWIAAIGTSLAFLVAAVSYARSVKVRREAQARLVYSKVIDSANYEPGDLFDPLPNGARMGNGCAAAKTIWPCLPGETAKQQALLPLNAATVIIHNGSQELIGPARIQMVNGGRERVWEDFSISVGTIEPQSNYVVQFTWINTDHPGFPAVGSTVIFRDASGQWWRRYLAEPIERVHHDPENTGPTAAERSEIRAYQKTIGIPDTQLIQEPRVSLRVWLHRRLRKLRGRTPLP